MKRMTWLMGALALAVSTAGATWALAADHLDSPAPQVDPSTDITDMYSWVDGGNVIFVLDVAPLATEGSKFSEKIQYVIHTESTAAFGKPGTPLDIICTFDASQKISCWVGDRDYVSGDASKTDGLVSAKLTKVFAGLRDDPFFFNLDGFKATVAAVDAAAPNLKFDPAGCPTIDAPTSGALVKALSTDPNSVPPGGAAKDFFDGKNVLSIVLSIDKKLLNEGGPILSAWASTNKGN